MFLKSITFVCTAFTPANTRGLIGIHNYVDTCKLVCIHYKCKIFKTFKPVAYSLGKIFRIENWLLTMEFILKIKCTY